MQNKSQDKPVNEQLLDDAYLELTKDIPLWEGDLYGALQRITEKVSAALQVQRVSIWQLDNNHKGPFLGCLDLFDTHYNKHSQGITLEARVYPGYFNALEQGRVINANNAHKDHRTCEFSENYLSPLGIGAMLDATLRKAGHTSGVLCIEHVGSSRLWTEVETRFAVSVADLVSQLLLYHEIRSKEQRYRTILANMPSVTYRCLNDKDWTMQYISDGVLSLTGYPPEDFVKNEVRSFASVIHPMDASRIEKSISEALDGPDQFELEYRVVNKNGEIRWVNEFGRLIRDINRQVKYIDGVINDITELKRAQDAAHSKQEIIIHISNGIASATGDAFFQTLTDELSQTLHADLVFVGKHLADSEEIETVAVSSHGLPGENFISTYLKTPCEEVIKRGFCSYPGNVQDEYPEDPFLKEFEVQGYLGTSLYNTNGEVIGLLVVLTKESIENTDIAENLLRIFAVRASSEIERLQQQRTLEDKEQHYRALFENSGDAIFVMRGDLFIDCNPATLRMFGCTREQIINQPPYRFSPATQPDGRDSKEKALEKINAAFTGEIQRFDWQHTRYDGTAFDAEVTLTVMNISGEPHLLANVRDVSQRNQAEKEIARQKRQLEATIEAMPGFFYMYDAKGKLVYSNRALQDTFTKPAEHPDQHILRNVIPEDIALTEETFRSIMTTGKPRTIELRVTTADGTVMPILATGARFIMANQPYLIGAAVDITERVHAENELARSQCELLERNQSLQLINDFSRRLHGSLNIDAILKEAVQSLRKISGHPMVAVMFIEKSTNELFLAASAGIPRDIVMFGMPVPINQRVHLPLEGTLAQLAFTEGCMQNSADVATEKRQDSILVDAKIKMGVKSEICIPLFDGETPMASISLLYTEQRQFSKLELETLEAVGKTLAIAINNARRANELAIQAHQDALTGLPNRIALSIEMQKVIASAAETKKKVALYLVDLDRFKEVNDTLGHEVGDRLICLIGPRLQEAFIHHDVFLARLGGDEFAILVRNVEQESALNEIRDIIKHAIMQPFSLGDVDIELGASIGVSIFPDHGLNFRELLRTADIAMYHAKGYGFHYIVYDQSFDQHTTRRLSLMTDLRAAVRDESLFLHFQPKIDLKTNTITGLEALLRWDHPVFGMVPPDEFIPLAEMSDLIQPITQLVIRKALMQMKTCAIQGLTCSIAVNISARNLLDASFPEALGEMLDDEDILKNRLEMEITESAIMADPERSLEVAHHIASLGVPLSIDDYGTGYSSLAYLKQLPLRALKIDRTFVKEMMENEQDAIIIQSTIVMAHGLGLKVIAEGVEDESTLKMLKILGCDEAQGYFISRPMLWKDLESWVKDSPYKLPGQS